MFQGPQQSNSAEVLAHSYFAVAKVAAYHPYYNLQTSRSPLRTMGVPATPPVTAIRTMLAMHATCGHIWTRWFPPLPTTPLFFLFAIFFCYFKHRYHYGNKNLNVAVYKLLFFGSHFRCNLLSLANRILRMTSGSSTLATVHGRNVSSTKPMVLCALIMAAKP